MTHHTNPLPGLSDSKAGQHQVARLRSALIALQAVDDFDSVSIRLSDGSRIQWRRGGKVYVKSGQIGHMQRLDNVEDLTYY